MNNESYTQLVSQTSIGKKLPDAIYIHRSALSQLPSELNDFLHRIAKALKISDENWHLVKLFKKQFKISYLAYPEFDTDSYPALTLSTSVDLTTLKHKVTDYKGSDNPPILHRKETFVNQDYPLYDHFVALTKEGEDAGLYENTRTIGFKQSWSRTIKAAGYELVDGHIVKSDIESDIERSGIDRHKTAIVRHELSQPMKQLAKHGLLEGQLTLFDYGCGRGNDLTELQAHGIVATGWDPIHRPDEDIINADIVNLGFVINVIEDQIERQEALASAWALADKLLVVSVMLGTEAIESQFKPYKDGVITSRNTFQRYYSQSEIKSYIERTLQEEAIALAPGIIAVFKDKDLEQDILVAKHRRHAVWDQRTQPVQTTSDDELKLLVTKHIHVFEPYWRKALFLGRIPTVSELENSEDLLAITPTIKRAQKACITYFGDEQYIKAQKGAKEDLLLYLALEQFSKRKPYSHLSETMQLDIKAHFNSYTDARNLARDLLFLLANTELIEEACSALAAQPGYRYLPGKSLQFHKDRIAELPLILRVYCGAALSLYGELDDIELIKVHTTSSKLTLLGYDDFDAAVPYLTERVKIKMGEQDVDFFDYINISRRPPLLYKSKYLSIDDENYDKQSRFDKRLAKIVGTHDEDILTRGMFDDAMGSRYIAGYTIKQR